MDTESPGVTTITPEPNPLTSILTATEISELSENVRQKLTESLQEFSRNLHNCNTQRQHDKISYSQHTYDLDTQLQDRTSKLETAKTQLEKEQKSVEELQEKLRHSLATISSLEEVVASTKTIGSGVREEKRELEQINSDLTLTIESRNNEINKLRNEISSLSGQLERCNVEKIEAVAKVDELMSNEIQISYREKQLTVEREWNTSQVRLLTEQLERKDSELLTEKRDSSVRYLHLQTDLAERNEQLRISEMEVASLRKTCQDQEAHIESLLKKLQESQEVERKMEENYRQELKAQRKVAELYRESTEENTKKLEELEDACANLQDLLKSATTRYGELETRFHSTSSNFQSEIDKRDELISDLKKELSSANSVLENIQKHGMTEEMIESLSPAAAAASNLLKGSKSITEIFSKYQEVAGELEKVKTENLKLTSYFNEILEDIDTRAPVLQKQKQEYERALQTVEILSSQLDVTMAESAKAKTEIVQYKKNVGAVERENERLKAQLKDLALQVRTLLREEMQEESVVPDGAQNVITRSLVTFRNIEELQSQNARLLAVVRELSEEKERGETEERERSLVEIKNAYKTAQNELADLRALRERQENQITLVIKDRDNLKSQLASLSAEKTAPKENEEREKLVEKLEEKCASLQKDFQTYKTEQKGNERISMETIEKLRDELGKSRGENARLAAQIEYSNERAKVYSKNLETYKKNIEVLEERNRELRVTVMKHEQSVVELKNLHTIESSSNTRKTHQLESLTSELSSLRTQRTHLQTELHLLQRSSHTHSLLQASIKEIKDSLTLQHTTEKTQLQNQIDQLTSENSILKRKISSENDRFKNTVTVFEQNMSKTSSIVSEKTQKIQELTQEIAQLNSKILQLQTTPTQPPTSKSETTPTTPTTSTTTPPSTLEISTLKTEIESLRNQQRLSSESIEEYRTLSLALEEQLTQANTQTAQLQSDLSSRLLDKDDLIRNLQLKIDGLEKEYNNYKEDKQNTIKEKETRLERVQKELESLNRTINKLTDDNTSLVNMQENLKKDLAALEALNQELQGKYETSLLANSDLNLSQSALKSELSEKKSQLEALEKNSDLLKQELTSLKEAFSSQKQNYSQEIDQLNRQLTELESLNKSLQDQLVTVVENMSPSVGEESQNEQWLTLIRYLRREKEIAVGKSEMAGAQSARLEAQLQGVNKELERVKIELSGVREEREVGIITSAKQAELLRKVETLSAVVDSNRTLRSENTSLQTQLQTLQSNYTTLKTTTDPLTQEIKALTDAQSTLTLENTSLKQELSRWRERATHLIEKTNKINPEEMKRLQFENENLAKSQTTHLENMKKQSAEISRLHAHVKLIQNQLTALQTNNQALVSEKSDLTTEMSKVTEELNRVKSEVSVIKGERERSLKDINLKNEELNKVKGQLVKTEASLEDHKSTVKQVKNIARKYKKQYEDLLAASQSEETLKKELETLKASPQVSDTEVKELTEKVTKLSEENADLASQVESLKAKTAELSAEVEEERFKSAAMKSQNDSRTSEKTSTIQSLKTELETVKKELEMLQKRSILLEKMTSKPSDATTGEEDKASSSSASSQQPAKPLTASIRPMSQPTPKQKQLVVSVAPVNNTSVQTAILAPVSQAQVSSSDYYTNRAVVGPTTSVVQQVVMPQNAQEVGEAEGGVGEGGEAEGEEVVRGEGHREGEENQQEEPLPINQEVSSSEVLQLMQQQLARGATEIQPVAPLRSEAPSTSTGNNKRARVITTSTSSNSEATPLSEETSQNKRARMSEHLTSEEEEEEEDEEEEEGENEAEASVPHDDDDEEEEEEDKQVITIGSDEEEEEEEDEEDKMEETFDQEFQDSREAESNNPPSNHGDEEDVSSNQQLLPLIQINPTPSQQASTEEEGIVPSTPTLFVPRRLDGFAEVSSPSQQQALPQQQIQQQQQQQRFTFNEEQEVGGSGRSVPSTPNLQQGGVAGGSGQGDEGEPRQELSSSEVFQVPEQPDNEQQTPTSSNNPETRTRPTPIVWDQPTSSTPRGGGRHPHIPRGTSRPTPRGMSRPFSRLNNPYQYQAPSPSVNTAPVPTTSRGGGAAGGQSARRSRPHYYGTLPPRGGGGNPNQPSSTSANNPFSKPF